MAVIGKVAAVFSANTSGLTSGVNRAGRSMKQMAGDVRGLRSGLNLLTAIQGARLFGQITAGVSRAVSSFVAMGQAQAGVIDRTAKLSRQLGMTYGELAGLGLAAELSGTSMDEVGKAVVRADRLFVEAAGGSKTAQKAFASLGLSVSDLQGMSASDRFDKMAAAISQLPTASERAAAAIQLFGRSGANMLNLFENGGSVLAASRQEAERFGIALTSAQAGDVEAMNDSFSRAQRAIEGIVQQVVAYLSPAVTAVSTAFTDFVGSVGGANIGQAIGDALLAGAQFFAGIADYVILGFGGAFEYASSVAQQWFGAFSFAGQIASAFAGVGNLLSTVFLGVVRAVLTPLMFIIEQAANLLSYVPGIGSTAEVVGASVAGFRQGLDQSILDKGSAALSNFGDAIGGSVASASQAAAGPFSAMLEQARQRAGQAAAQRDISERQTVGPRAVVPAAAAPGPSTEALKAVDSTSKEGIAEMFRLMRGDGGTVQEEQLGVLEQIRDTLQSQPADEWTEAAFAGT